MTAFIFRRVLIAIPTVFIVLIVCFFLSKQVPGDEVEIYNGNNIEGSGSIKNDPLAYEESYKRSCLQLGLNKPLFYWSLLTMAHPDTLDRIVFLPKKKLAIHYVALCGNWPLVQSYFNSIDKAQAKVIALPDSLQAIKLSMQSWLSSRKVSADTLAWNKQKLSITNTELGQIAGDLDSIRQLQRKILATDPEIYLLYPKLKWNGSNNQFHYWLRSLFTGKNNVSLIDSRPVGAKVKEAIKWTLSINLIALIISIWFSIWLGKYLGRKRGSKREKLISNILFSAYTLPGFWIGSLCIVFLTNSEYGQWLNIFPASGVGEWDSANSLIGNLLNLLYHFLLPVFCLSYPAIAYLTAHIRDGITDVMKEPYFITAIAKGLSKKEAVKEHGIKNAIFPLISLMGGILPSLISGSVIIEVLFNIPGMGRLIYNSILSRDWPVVFQVVFMTACIVILAQILVDILYRLFDPRIKYTA